MNATADRAAQRGPYSVYPYTDPRTGKTEEYLGVTSAAAFLNLERRVLIRLQRDNPTALPLYKLMGTRLYYKRSDLEHALETLLRPVPVDPPADPKS